MEKETRGRGRLRGVEGWAGDGREHLAHVRSGGVSKPEENAAQGDRVNYGEVFRTSPTCTLSFGR